MKVAFWDTCPTLINGCVSLWREREKKGKSLASIDNKETVNINLKSAIVNISSYESLTLEGHKYLALINMLGLKKLLSKKIRTRII